MAEAFRMAVIAGRKAYEAKLTAIQTNGSIEPVDGVFASINSI
jgi:thiazole synthase ThiGH ThiG subunit